MGRILGGRLQRARGIGGLCGRGGPGIGPGQISVLSPGRTGEVLMLLFLGGAMDGEAGAWSADGAVG